MNFDRFDIVLIVTMSMAIILLSFIMPATGMTSANNTSQADIPEFNISSSEWDIAGDFPERTVRSSAPSQGVIKWDQSRDSGGLDRRVTLYEDGSDKWRLNLRNNGTDSSTDLYTNLSYLFDDSIQFQSWDGEFTEVGQVEVFTVTHNNQTWEVEQELISLENANESNMTAEVEYQLYGQPPGQNTNLIQRLPIVGTIFDTLDALSAVLFWIGQVFWWFAYSTIEVSLTLVTILLSVMVFGVDVMVFLSTTYFDMVDSAPGWAAVIVSIPGIIISVEFVKIGMIGVKLLPFT